MAQMQTNFTAADMLGGAQAKKAEAPKKVAPKKVAPKPAPVVVEEPVAVVEEAPVVVEEVVAEAE